MTRTIMAAAAALAFLAAPIALEAQNRVPVQHGVTGPVTTTSDIAGGAFSPEAAAGAVAEALQRASSSVTTRLTVGTLTGPDGVRLPIPVQARVLRGLGDDAAELDALVSALGTPEAVHLRVSLSRLLLDPQPGRVARAAEDFNTFIDAADHRLLADPPGELVALHVVLNVLSLAAIDAAR